jgi:hypothetical protein
MMKNLLILITTFIFPLLTNAQGFEVGLQAGTSFYTGEIDVSPKTIHKQLGMAMGIWGRYPIFEKLYVRGQIYRGSLTANEKLYPTSEYRLQRGFSFNASFTEIGTQVEYRFLGLDNGFQLENDDPIFSLYAFGGVGLTYFNPTTDYNEANALMDVSADKYALFTKNTIAIPVGMGTKFKLTDALYIGGELSMRKTFTDYIDGISKITNTTKSKDLYVISGVYVSWVFGQGNSGAGNWNSGGGKRRIKGCPTF